MSLNDAVGDAPLQTAVALILFRRPDRTAKVMEGIREARPAKLFLIADGPHPGDEEETRDCESARAAAERVDWPCEVVRNYADQNLGLKTRISTGIDGVFEQVDRAIILEDDCLPHSSFFRYCDELLERYHDDDRIMHVAGSQLLDRAPGNGASYHFSRYVHIWGWGTWRRAWRHFDVGLRDWHADSKAERDRGLKQMFGDQSERRYWRYRWDNSGQIDNWDAQWSYALLARDGLAINPNRNLISNIGFGADATNAIEDPHGIGGRPLEGMHFPLAHPSSIAPDAGCDAQASRLFMHPDPTRPPALPRPALGTRLWQGTLRAGGRALDFVPKPIRPRIRHRDRRPATLLDRSTAKDRGSDL
jgi:hypothetical protein